MCNGTLPQSDGSAMRQIGFSLKGHFPSDRSRGWYSENLQQNQDATLSAAALQTKTGKPESEALTEKV